jgi:hypothetical protein
MNYTIFLNIVHYGSAARLRTPDPHLYVHMVIRYPDITRSGWWFCNSWRRCLWRILFVSAGVAEKCNLRISIGLACCHILLIANLFGTRMDSLNAIISLVHNTRIKRLLVLFRICHPYALAVLYPQEDSWYSFLLEAVSTPGPYCGWKD